MRTGLNIGLSALRAAQKGIQLTGHNIANVGTENYSRQRIHFASIPPTDPLRLTAGAGVEQVDIRAVRDQLVDALVLARDPMVGSASCQSGLLGVVEGLFPTDLESGLGTLIDNFFNSFRELARNPAGTAERGAVVSHAETLADGFNDLATRLAEFDTQLGPYIQQAVDDANQLAREVHELNLKIADAAVAGHQPNDLLDQQTTALRRLAELMPLEVTRDELQRAHVRMNGLTLIAPHGPVELETRTTGHSLEVVVGELEAPLDASSGKLGALLHLDQTTVPGYRDRLDALATTLAREVNRRHSTGVGRDGGFTALDGTTLVGDAEAPLADAALPFDIAAGSLFVSVIHQATGEVVQTRLDIDPASQSLDDVAAALDGVAHLRAAAGGGRLHVDAEAGYRFAFTNRVPTHPGTLGTAAATLDGAVDLEASDTYTFTVDTSQTHAGAGGTCVVGSEPLVADLEADGGNTYAGTATSGGAFTGEANQSYLIEIVDGGDLAAATYRVSEDGGTTWGSTLALDGGTIDVYDDLNGTDLGVDATFGPGTFAAGDRFSIDAYAPAADLRVVVTDSQGATVATLEAGEGYEPGDDLALPGGIRLALGEGLVGDGDSFAVELAAEPDEPGLLAALGMNTLFRGTAASNLSVEPAVAADLDRLAAARTEAHGDNTNALRMGEVQALAFPELDDETVGDFYSHLIGRVGTDARTAQQVEEGARLLLETAQNHRDSISGVNQDEEAVELLRYQQLYLFAARYLKTIEELTGLLMEM
ncbi:MAG: flagellar hook-associated protein FlgK [Candidatus Brocadiia bacterium]